MLILLPSTEAFEWRSPLALWYSLIFVSALSYLSYFAKSIIFFFKSVLSGGNSASFSRNLFLRIGKSFNMKNLPAIVPSDIAITRLF
jgi:hypothetical protein